MILHYTEDVKKALGSKTKSEPWLHIAIYRETSGFGCMYAIYVWDTRKVLESDTAVITVNQLRHTATGPAVDSKTKLIGSGWVVNDINAKLLGLAENSDSLRKQMNRGQREQSKINKFLGRR